MVALGQHFYPRQNQCLISIWLLTVHSVYELHLYELLKFVLKSLNGHHCIKFCNSMFRKQNEGVNTRNSTLNLLNIPIRECKVERNSVQIRGSVLYNKLRLIGVLPDNVENVTSKNLSDICHKVKYSYICNNSERAEYVYGNRSK